MKYIKKIPEENKEYTEKLLNNGWKKLKEPKNIHLTMLASLPIGLALSLISIYCYSFLYDPFQKINNGGLTFTIKIGNFILFVISVTVFLIIHEFIHLVFIPDFLRSEKTYWGMKWNYFFVLTEEKMSRNRVLAVFLMPLLILSGVFPLILSTFGMFNLFWWLICLFNAMGSCVDVFFVFLIAFQVPKNGIVKNNGGATFYKTSDDVKA